MSKVETWLITGAAGLLGSTMCVYLKSKNIKIVGVSRSHQIETADIDKLYQDLSVPGNVSALVNEVKPDVVVHCAALTSVDLCEKKPDMAQDINSKTCASFSDACNDIDAKFVMISTDQLWKNADAFIDENRPLDVPNVYGATKADGERHSLNNSNSLVIRTNFFGVGPDWKPSGIDQLLSVLRSDGEYNGFTDVHFTPIYVETLCDLIFRAVKNGSKGIFNVVGQDRVSKFEFAKQVAQCFGFDGNKIKPTTVSTANLEAFRPLEMSLSGKAFEKELGMSLPTLDQSLSCYKNYIEQNNLLLLD